MIKNKNIRAIGRSSYLYNGIRHLATRGNKFKAIITEKAYEEYDIRSDDFEALADESGGDYFFTKTVNKYFRPHREIEKGVIFVNDGPKDTSIERLVEMKEVAKLLLEKQNNYKGYLLLM